MSKHDFDAPGPAEGGQGASPHAPSSASARPRAADALAQIADCDLAENWRFWSGKRTGKAPEDPAAMRLQVLEWLVNPVVVEARVATLPRRLLSILDACLECARYQTTAGELLNARHLAYMSSYDLQASLAVLSRHGLLVEVRSAHAASFGQRAWAVPQDIGDAILRRRRARQRGIFDLFTLRGHIDRMYEDPARAARTPAARVRELYKMYSNEASAVARFERMSEPLKGFLAKAVLEFGGIVPRSLYERMEAIGPWDGRRWGHAMEESLVGTVEKLELGRYGIAHNDETVLVFNEVALAWLRRVAVPGDPDKPHEEACYGVDLVSNISRFIAYVLDHDVRFTTRGEIFKTTERRIESELIPNPGRELSRADTLAFIYRFARGQHLIDSTGERTFALTHAGREWEPKDLEAKVRALLEYCIEERDLPGEHYHQARMRRIYMRLLKRVEPGVWYDLMYVPFLARNTYLCSLDDLAVDEYFAARFQGGQYVPMDDVQRLSWHLVTWVRQRLYLLGIVDLGYDKSGRPVAMRLTRLGARILGVADETQDTVAGVGNIVVTPDFEVVLFPTGDDAELVHDLDRFCTRESKGSILKFKIDEKSVVRALHEGMYLRRIQRTLEQHSRTPVPNNVLYSIRDWGRRAGVLHLDAHHVVSGEDEELMARFKQDPGVRPLLREVLDGRHVKLKGGSTLRRLQSLLRELGWLVEIDE